MAVFKDFQNKLEVFFKKFLLIIPCMNNGQYSINNFNKMKLFLAIVTFLATIVNEEFSNSNKAEITS